MTEPSKEVRYVWHERTVSAVLDEREVGHITVPDIRLHWGEGVPFHHPVDDWW